MKKEFILQDIFDIIDIKNGIPQNDEKVIESNIIYILQRENLWNPKYTIVFPCGSTQSLNAENFQYDFEIFKGLNSVIAFGTCYGSCFFFKGKKGIEIVDMNLEIASNSKFFKINDIEKEKVVFT